MNRVLTLATAAAVLALAGCAASSTTASSGTVRTHGAYRKLDGVSISHAYCCAPTTGKPAPSPTKTCPPSPTSTCERAAQASPTAPSASAASTSRPANPH